MQRYLKPLFPRKLQLNQFMTIKRKYTYPKFKIPVSKCSKIKEAKLENYVINLRIFPLEPREIDLEPFQQLHTTDNQEELQEFLLLESQCNENFRLTG